MTTLTQAHTLADNIDAAKSQFEVYLRSTLQDYIDFLPQRGQHCGPRKFKSASDYTFLEIDGGSNFVFESEEFHEYGEYVQDIVELPFAFIDAPEAFKTNILDSMAAAEAKRTAKNREAAQTRVDNLRRQLEVAERSLKD